VDLDFVSVWLLFIVIGPFTDVLREIWLAVTRKVGKIRNRGCRGWILASV
jgi:hypothetical protein